MSGIVGDVILGLCTAVTSGFGTWFFTRKKYNAEVKGEEVKNFDAALDAYKKMYEDMISDLKSSQEELKQENNELKIELAETRKQVMTLTNFVLASAIKRADGTLTEEDINSLRKML